MADQRTSSKKQDNLFDLQAINILENMTSAFFALDRQDCFVYVNYRAELLLQRSRQDLLDKNIWEEYPNLKNSTFEREYRRVMQDSSNTVFEEFHDSLGLWFEVHLCGNQDYLAVYFQDITPYKRTQLELITRNEELQTLRRIAEIALNTESLKVAFQQIVEEIGQATGYPIVALELYNPAQQMMVFMGSRGVPLPSDSDILQVPVSETLSGRVALTGQGLVKKYSPEDHKVCQTNEVLSQLGIKTFICMPMVVNQQVLGVLSLAHPELVEPDEVF